VSALGVLFYYGTLVGAAHGTTTLTLESLQGDLTWNHPRFNARLLRVWLSGGTVPFVIRREKIWHFHDPNQPFIWRAFDVRPMAVPQPFVLVPARSAGERAIKWTCVLAAIAGLLLLSAADAGARSTSEAVSSRARDLSLEAGGMIRGLARLVPKRLRSEFSSWVREKGLHAASERTTPIEAAWRRSRSAFPAPSPDWATSTPLSSRS
jgi:hypothetical protein